MGLPEIYISFETAAVSAVKRSSRGVVALAVTDATKGGAASAVYRSLSEVDESKFTAENYRLLKLCFLAAPSKVAVLRIGSDEADTFTALDTLDFDYLAAPGLTQAKVISYIKAERAKGRGVKAVVANATAPDDEGIINFCAEDIVLTDGAVTADNYAARIAGLLAATPLTRSATYAKLSEVVSCGAQSDADAAIDAGKLILVPNGEGYCLGRAVNSLTTVTTAHGAAFRKIKIVDGVDLIRTDITDMGAIYGDGRIMIRRNTADLLLVSKCTGALSDDIHNVNRRKVKALLDASGEVSYTAYDLGYNATLREAQYSWTLEFLYGKTAQ